MYQVCVSIARVREAYIRAPRFRALINTTQTVAAVSLYIYSIIKTTRSVDRQGDTCSTLLNYVTVVKVTDAVLGTRRTRQHAPFQSQKSGLGQLSLLSQCFYSSLFVQTVVIVCWSKIQPAPSFLPISHFFVFICCLCLRVLIVQIAPQTYHPQI